MTVNCIFVAKIVNLQQKQQRVQQSPCHLILGPRNSSRSLSSYTYEMPSDSINRIVLSITPNECLGEALQPVKRLKDLSNDPRGSIKKKVT